MEEDGGMSSARRWKMIIDGVVVPRCGAGKSSRSSSGGVGLVKKSCMFAWSVVFVASVSRRHVQVLVFVRIC